MLTLYGIPNCDSCRKARRWLDQRGADFRFHDLRADGIDAARITAWLQHVPAERLVNRRSTSWRQMDAGQRAAADGDDVAALLAAHPTLIKRPLLETADTCLVGFHVSDWAAAVPEAGASSA